MVAVVAAVARVGMRAAECTRIKHSWDLYFSCLKVGAGGGGRIDLASTLALKLFSRVGARVVGGGGRKNDKKQRPSLESTP